MDLLVALTAIGFTEYEAKVYLALLRDHPALAIPSLSLPQNPFTRDFDKRINNLRHPPPNSYAFIFGKEGRTPMTAAKMIANRANAQHSTGPQDTSRTRFNGVQHGLTSKQTVLPGESQKAHKRPLAQIGRPQMTTFERVGFIGLGGMGRGLVKNLVAKGVAVTAYDLNPAAVAAAKSFGATVAGGVQEIRDNCRIIMICVNEAEDVEALLISGDGLLAGQAPGFIIVDHTTGSPQMVAKLDRMVRAAGGRYAEAPMTRTPKHADIGKVNVLFGGERDLLDDLRPYFELYAENIFHIGPLGHAIRIKLIHNYIAFANVAAWCEGFALAAKDGLDLSQVIGIISAAGAKSGMLDLYGQATLDGDFTPLMSLANARKDVRYYARWLEEAGLPGFMADAVHQTYRQAALLGHDGESCTAVIKAYEAVTGVEARVGPKHRPNQEK